MIDHNKKQYSEMPLDFDKMFDEAAEAGAGEDPEMAEAKKKMPSFMKGLMKGAMGGMSAKVTSTTELLECSDKTAPAGNYDLPAGYKKVKGFGKLTSDHDGLDPVLLG